LKTGSDEFKPRRGETYGSDTTCWNKYETRP
jgi:hypothetical protein